MSVTQHRTLKKGLLYLWTPAQKPAFSLALEHSFVCSSAEALGRAQEIFSDEDLVATDVPL